MVNNGKLGEHLFQQKMIANGYTIKDVSGNSEYWTKDIDFFATSPFTGVTKSFEVKFDSRIHQTGNLYLELSNIHSKGGRGWFDFCQADYLAYGDAQTRIFYIIPMIELKEKIKSLPKRTANCGNDSTGLLVKLNDI